MLMHMWLIGNQSGRIRPPLRVHGLEHCLKRTEDMMAGFSWDEWPRFFSIAFYRVAERENTLVLDSDEFRITSSPTVHYVPTIGLRVDVKSSGLSVAYSCDTAPVDSVVRLAKDADILIHEATGDDPAGGHTGAADAGKIASRANAKRLVLIHYEVWDNKDTSHLIPEAKQHFDGPVELAQDFLQFDLSQNPLPAEGPIGKMLF
jgi:ribonuclease Z